MKQTDWAEIILLSVLVGVAVMALLQGMKLDKKLVNVSWQVHDLELVSIAKDLQIDGLRKELRETQIDVKFIQLEPLAAVLCEDLSIRTGQIGKLQVIRNSDHGAVCAVDYDKYYTIEQMRDMLQWFD
jgi:hypothetical protein